MILNRQTDRHKMVEQIDRQLHGVKDVDRQDVNLTQTCHGLSHRLASSIAINSHTKLLYL